MSIGLKRRIQIIGIVALVCGTLIGAGPAGASRAGASTSWSVVASPNVSNGESDQLSGVSCVTAANCVAVGSAGGSGFLTTLVETWNGSAWSVTPSPNPTGRDGTLSGVSCPTKTDCVAVGAVDPYGAGIGTLIETWNGTTWSITPSPNTGNGSSLAAVSCKRADSCVAVGSSYYNIDYTNVFGGQSVFGVYQTLVATWDGTAWSIIPSPNPTTSPNGAYLNGVTCRTVKYCVAVGASNNATPPPSNPAYQSLVEIWNGKSWSVVPSPNKASSAGPDYTVLQTVSCPSVSSCFAAGVTGNVSYGAARTLVEAWNGMTWSITPSPNQGTNNNGFQGVACGKANSCVAVGEYENYALNPPQYSTLIETWNGSTWSITPRPNPNSYDNQLSGGVSCKFAHCMAVGESSDPGGTLVLRN